MKVTQVLPATGVTIQCDGYVPLVARNCGEFTYCHKYWRTGDFTDSILEFGIEPQYGAICKVTLTLLRSLGNGTSPNPDCSATMEGIPCFNLLYWGETVNRIDEHGSLIASLVHKRLCIRCFNRNARTCRGIRNGRLLFLIDQDNDITGVELLDLSEVEVANIRRTIQ